MAICFSTNFTRKFAVFPLNNFNLLVGLFGICCTYIVDGSLAILQLTPFLIGLLTNSFILSTY